MLCPPDESLMDAAKETGQQMYSSMSHDERVEKINLMVSIANRCQISSYRIILIFILFI